MGGVNPEEVDGFLEYGTQLTNGSPVSTSQRKGHVLKDEDVKDLDITDYMEKWNPSYMWTN